LLFKKIITFKKLKTKIIMKKLILSTAVIIAFALSSCGGKDGEDQKDAAGPTICDCVKMGEEVQKEMEEAGGDEAKLKEIEEKYELKAEECKKLVEGKSDDQMKKLQEEASKCK